MYRRLLYWAIVALGILSVSHPCLAQGASAQVEYGVEYEPDLVLLGPATDGVNGGQKHSEGEGSVVDEEVRGADAREDGSFRSVEVSKRDLEFNQYVPAYRLRGEPSCEELRAMWRLSKREARRATSANHIPRTRPYSYGRLISFAPNHHSRAYAYGETKNFAHAPGHRSPVKGAFNTLRGMLGMRAGRPGSMQRVLGLVAADRAPGETSKGKYDELRELVLDAHRGGASVDDTSAIDQAPVRRTSLRGSSSRYAPEGFVGPLLSPGNSNPISPVSETELAPWNPRTRQCESVRGQMCEADAECTCAGQHRCSNSRCKVLPAHSGNDLLLRQALLNGRK